MLDFDTLLHQVKGQTKVLEVAADEQFDFSDKDYAYVIEAGSLLVIGEKNSETGVSPTHTLEVHDPVGFAEAIAARSPKLRFKQVTDLTVRQFNSADLRKFIERANVFSKRLSNIALEEYLVRQELRRTSRLRRGSLIKIMIY